MSDTKQQPCVTHPAGMMMTVELWLPPAVNDVDYSGLDLRV